MGEFIPHPSAVKVLKLSGRQKSTVLKAVDELVEMGQLEAVQAGAYKRYRAAGRKTEGITGSQKPSSAAGDISGLYFLAASGWQGRVLAPCDQGYLVQLYSWLDGEPNGTKVVDASQVDGWRFYDCHKSWRDAGARAIERECEL
jgi:hypothetical protein